MKSDDDTFVHVERMASMLSSKKKKKGLYIGKIAWNAGPIRYNDHKWYMSYEDFPGQMYPPFAFGPGYVISRDVAEHIISLKNEKKLKVLLFFFKKKRFIVIFSFFLSFIDLSLRRCFCWNLDRQC